MARIDTFLRVAADQRASDLHFHAGKPPTIRYQGDLLPLPFRVLSADETRRFLEEILDADKLEMFARDQELDFAYVIDDVGCFRVNMYLQSAGMGAVFRFIPPQIPTTVDLRLPPVLSRLAQQSRGLVLITGPTGSGKTTTLAALIQEINGTSSRHVITIEDPIEYVHEPIESVVTQREVGQHTESFAGALRSALREAPDVLVVGELRDFETIQLALSAAETGVLVFGTLHTNSAAKAVDRLVGACPGGLQEQVRAVLSVLLRGVVAQRLCRLATGDGRVAALEVLLPSYSVAHLIRENKAHQIDAYIRTSEHSTSGMQSLERSLWQLVREGLVSTDEARAVANDTDALDKLLASEAW